MLAAFYFHALDYRAEDLEWESRDRFLLTLGHYATALYAVLMEAGTLPEDELKTYGSTLMALFLPVLSKTITDPY